MARRSQTPSVPDLAKQFNALRRKKYPLAVIALILLASLWGGSQWLEQIFAPAATSSTTSSTASTSAAAVGDECRVVNIYDGDTMTLQCPGNAEQTKVRMYCIDAPEMKQAP